MINGITKNMIEPVARLPAPGKPKQWGNNLEATEVFQKDVPRLHVNDDIRVVTVNGESKGLVRRIGAGVFLWSNAVGEGRTNTEEEAFLQLGFHYYRNHKCEQCLRVIGDKEALKLAQ
jgi:hypothetical protein